MLRGYRRRVARALTTSALAAAAVVAVEPAAHAECSVMTFTFDATAGGAVLSPDRVTVTAGGCVDLHNNTITSADFTVGSGFRRTVAAFGTTQYTAQAAGTSQPVTASGAAGSARGTIVIRPRPAPSTSARPTRSPTPKRTPSPSPSLAPAASSAPASPSSQPSSPPASPPTTEPSRPLPSASGPVTPLPSAPAAGPSPSPSVAVVAGPLQPPTNRGTGLPAAIAALAVVATAGAWMRVLLAEPTGRRAVDERNSVVAAA